MLDYLSKSFSRVTFLTFREKLFPELNEDTLLLLADNKGACAAEFVWRDVPHAGALATLQDQGAGVLPETDRLNAQALSQGHERLIEYFIPQKARALYRNLKSLPVTQRLGELADVGIGYVTGANEFFHLSPTEVRRWEIPETLLKPAVRRGRALSGLRFTAHDLHNALKVGEASYLLSIDAEATIPESVRKYLEYGEILGVPQAHKCRTRSPWFSVPHVYLSDAFLSYMSGVMPRLVTNDAGVVAPNSLHILRLYPHTTLPSSAIAALWQTSLTRLSVEIEGHALGGGMLKIEPTEAENVIVPSSQANIQMLVALGEELDDLMRNGDEATAQARADSLIVKNLTNRFGDLCTESITLHMRFPYAIVCMFFAFPADVDEDVTRGRVISTFQRAGRLVATISGRAEYTDPGEKFEHVMRMLFQPVKEDGTMPWVKLFDAKIQRELTEPEYFVLLREIYNNRNPHALIEAIVESDRQSRIPRRHRPSLPENSPDLSD